MKIAIMQPNFIPWLGFFELMRAVDTFVLLDDVEFSKNTWHNRNRLLLKDGSVFTWTVPIKGLKNSSTFNNLYINQKAINFRKLMNLFEQNFGHSSNFTILGEILEFIKIEELKFSEVNELILKRMMKFLDLNTEIVISSCLGVTGKRSERILNILKELEASVYVANQNASDYMLVDDFENKFHGDVELLVINVITHEKLNNPEIKLSALNYILDTE